MTVQGKPSWQPHLLDEVQPWYKTLGQNLITFLTEPMGSPRLDGRIRTPGLRLDVEIHPWHRAFSDIFESIRLLRRKEQLPAGAQRVRIKDIWDLSPWRGQFQRSELYSALAHVVVLTLLTVPFLITSTEAKQDKPVELVPMDLSDIGQYKVTLPQSTKKAGGGGGGGERNPLPASKGRLPKFSLNAQLTPPAAVIRNPNPRLAAEPTVVVPPDIHIQSPNIAAYGDPTSNATIPSGGPGYGGGIGTGSGGGVGSGMGPGVGPGRGGGYGGGLFRVGGSVSAPVCIYCPQPEYSEEARKARYQGVVVLWAVIDEQGQVRDVRIAKSLGMGLDEEAIRTVKNWRFKPSERYGKPVPVQFTIEVDFHLY
jgi:TonB family protein